MLPTISRVAVAGGMPTAPPSAYYRKADCPGPNLLLLLGPIDSSAYSQISEVLDLRKKHYGKNLRTDE
jgi:hypothetical protein